MKFLNDDQSEDVAVLGNDSEEYLKALIQSNTKYLLELIYENEKHMFHQFVKDKVRTEVENLCKLDEMSSFR